MAKRKNLKRHINYICGELLAECVGIFQYQKDVKKESFDDVLARIAMMQNDFLNRISHTEPTNAKRFYKQLRKDFQMQVEEILDIIQGLG